MTRRLVILLLAVAALTLAVSACGGDDEEEAEEPAAADTTTAEATTEETTTEETGGGGGGTTLELAADPGGELAFDKTTLEAPAGEVTIHLVNEASIPHNVEVEGNGVEEVSDTITGAETDLTLTLEAGEYEFYCAVPGHREAGMEGTLVVE